MPVLEDGTWSILRLHISLNLSLHTCTRACSMHTWAQYMHMTLQCSSSTCSRGACWETGAGGGEVRPPTTVNGLHEAWPGEPLPRTQPSQSTCAVTARTPGDRRKPPGAGGSWGAREAPALRGSAAGIVLCQGRTSQLPDVSRELKAIQGGAPGLGDPISACTAELGPDLALLAPQHSVHGDCQEWGSLPSVPLPLTPKPLPRGRDESTEPGDEQGTGSHRDCRSARLVTAPGPRASPAEAEHWGPSHPTVHTRPSTSDCPHTPLPTPPHPSAHPLLWAVGRTHPGDSRETRCVWDAASGKGGGGKEGKVGAAIKRAGNSPAPQPHLAHTGHRDLFVRWLEQNYRVPAALTYTLSPFQKEAAAQ